MRRQFHGSIEVKCLFIPLALVPKTLYNYEVTSAYLQSPTSTAKTKVSTILLCAFVLALNACSPGKNAKAPVAGEQGAPVNVAVIDANDLPQLGVEVLMQAERDESAQKRLASLVHHQLGRAHQLQKNGAMLSSLEMISGALLLLDQDSWIDSALLHEGEVLLQAGHQAAKKGNAGRSEALYALAQNRLRIQAQKEDVQKHLEALNSWSDATRGSQPLIAAGHSARNAIEAAVVNPDAEAYHLATEKVILWMTLGAQSTILDRGPKNSKEREEAIEAYRALRTGAPSLLALSLRHRDLAGGLESLRAAELTRALPTRVESVVIAAAQDNETEAWRQIYGLYEGMRNEEDSEYSFQRNLAQAAVFHAALAMYRSSPERLESTLQLAQSLNQLGLSEVATALMARLASPDNSPQTIAQAMQLFSDGLLHLAESGQFETARLSFKEAAPLLEVAQRPEHSEHGSAAAAAYGLLAEIELHEGNCKEALPLIQGAIERGAPHFLYLRLGQVQWQLEKAQAAKQSLKKASALAQTTGNAFFEAEAKESLFLIERHEKQSEAATLFINQALARAEVAASTRLSTPGALNGARLHARMLQYFDAPEELAKAYGGAFELSQSREQNTIVLTEMSRAAAVTLNVKLAREATQLALDLKLDDESLLYIALWQKLTEKLKASSPDGQVREALARTHGLRGWLHTLRQFALGELSDEALLQSAQGPAQKAEAYFYLATLSKKVTGQVNREQLRYVSTSSAIGLQEVRIARELLNPQRLPLPTK